MEPTLAEEIRALLAMLEYDPPWVAVLDARFPSLVAKMLSVIEERDFLKARVDSQKAESEFRAQEIREAVAGIDGAYYWAPLDAVRHIAKEVIRLRKELAHLRWEAECLQVEAK